MQFDAPRGSDEWWLSRLMEKLAAQVKEVDLMGRWLRGTQPIPCPDNQKPGFERLQRIANVNLAELIVDARVHRMQLLGASTVGQFADSGDDRVDALFEEQDLRALLSNAFRAALGEGVAYLMVTAEGGIRFADGKHAVLEDGPDGTTLAAVNIYRDEVADRDVAILARPGYFRFFYHEGPTGLPGQKWWRFFPGAWTAGERVESPLDEVPMYRLTPPGGRSLIRKHIAGLERINHGILQRMILISLQAFKQRALKNAPREDPKTGEPIDYDAVFETAPDALWILPESVEIWESGQADFGPVLTAVKDDIRAVAVASKTPLFMISPDDANGSAEGAATQREILVFDIESITALFEGKLKRVLSAALRLRGDLDPEEATRLKLLWANPRRSSLMERAQSLSTARGGGVPFRMALEKFGEFTPAEVEEAVQQRTADAFLEAAIAASGANSTTPASAGSTAVSVTGGTPRATPPSGGTPAQLPAPDARRAAGPESGGLNGG